MEQYDVVIVGAGVIGCAVARYLARYDVRILVLEKEEDVCSGASKANSGIVHAGFDAPCGSMKARMNVRGSMLMGPLASTLDFGYVNNGSLVLCFDRADFPRLQELYERGVSNGVPGLRIFSAQEVREKEPSISDSVVAALWAPTAGVVCPFSMTVAFAENAADNGVKFSFLEKVLKTEKTDSGFTVVTDKGTYGAKAIVNAAGVYADQIHNMVCGKKINITPRRGEYVLLDKEAGGLVSSTIFQLPGALGKGVLVTRTVHGNILVGPNAHAVEDREDTQTTAGGMEEVKTRALESVPGIPYNRMITSFAGLRAHEDGGDFILGEAEDCSGFWDCAGIESPGLSSAPAIGEYLSDLMAQRYGYREKPDFKAERKGFTEVAKLPLARREELIKERPEYGRIVCRCENISEGEIVDAIKRNPGARSMDGIKRRVRQGMGRCQAGFCTPAAMQILARELGISMEEVTKNRPGSEYLNHEEK